MSTPWEDASRSRIRMVQDGLLAATQMAAQPGVDPALAEMLTHPYREMLDELYEQDLSLAKLADQSDLLIHVKGPAASGPTPRVSVLTKVLTSTRDQVTRLAKQMAGVFATRVPASLDMGFVGVARGSLFVGFSAADDSADAALTLKAVSLIGDASQLVANDESLETLAAMFPDPAERDLAISAIRQLSPSGQTGVNEVDLFGRQIKQSVQLTTDTRRHARRLMAEPARAALVPLEFVELIGTIREVDLDAHRFELRNVEGYPQDVRCAHELDDDEIKKLIDRRVRVRGNGEMSASGAVRLLWVDEVEVL